ncbi:Dual specificity tyrosine-phosphorylation-regulated kinase 1A [Chytriomyces hyalinus]|nr:Dual specificity tyrosine-phosphorylation-regulated kinase 1A [Chytriomyces hyalinus]
MNAQPNNTRRNPLIQLTSGIEKTYNAVDKHKIHRDHPSQASQASASVLQPCDDEKDDYIFRQGEVWQDRFQVLRRLGKGSFGQVFEALDLRAASDSKSQRVAIKIIKNRTSFYKQALTEIRILELLNLKDADQTQHIVRMRGHFVHRNHLCIVYEILSNNLYEVIKAGRFAGLSMTWIRKIASQLLTSLQFLRRNDIQVIHCDLKPENIMLRSEKSQSVKVIDFGSSCFFNERAYTYIQSRFYRSPEVILGHSYTTAIDMWSLGCILYELFSGEPLFSGQNEHDQLLKIMDLMGLPPKEWLEASASHKLAAMFTRTSSDEIKGPNFTRNSSNKPENTALRPNIPSTFQSRRQTFSELLQSKFQKMLQQGHHSPGRLSSALKKNGSGALQDDTLYAYSALSADFEMFRSLLTKMLVYDPRDRITPEEALRHAFFRKNVMERETNTTATMMPGRVGSVTGTNVGGMVGNK